MEPIHSLVEEPWHPQMVFKKQSSKHLEEEFLIPYATFLFLSENGQEQGWGRYHR